MTKILVIQGAGMNMRRARPDRDFRHDDVG